VGSLRAASHSRMDAQDPDDAIEDAAVIHPRHAACSVGLIAATLRR
jgi:hypothetical protein